MKILAHPSIRESFWERRKGSDILHIDSDGNVGWAFDKKSAKASSHMHNHWLKDDGTLISDMLFLEYDLQLEND